MKREAGLISSHWDLTTAGWSAGSPNFLSHRDSVKSKALSSVLLGAIETPEAAVIRLLDNRDLRRPGAHKILVTFMLFGYWGWSKAPLRGWEMGKNRKIIVSENFVWFFFPSSGPSLYLSLSPETPFPLSCWPGPSSVTRLYRRAHSEDLCLVRVPGSKPWLTL